MSLAARLRAADDRVPLVERALLARELGLGADDLPLLLNTTVTDLLEAPGAVVRTLHASRLLARLDAHVARAHPVSLERPTADVLVATLVTTDEELVVTAALDLAVPAEAACVVVEVDDREVAGLSLADAEALAYALLRLVTEADADRADRDPARAELAAAFRAHRDGSLRRRVVNQLAEELP